MDVLSVVGFVGFGVGIGIFIYLFVSYLRDSWATPKPPSEHHVCKAKDDWTLLATGSSGNLPIERAWLQCAQKVFRLFCKKQHDYGEANIGLGGHIGLAFKFGDKVSRYWELLGLGGKGESDPSWEHETLLDTVMDLADYGVIAMMIEEGLWPRYQIDETFGTTAIVAILYDICQRLPDDDVVKICERLMAKEIADTFSHARILTQE